MHHQQHFPEKELIIGWGVAVNQNTQSNSFYYVNLLIRIFLCTFAVRKA